MSISKVGPQAVLSFCFQGRKISTPEIPAPIGVFLAIDAAGAGNIHTPYSFPFLCDNFNPLLCLACRIKIGQNDCAFGTMFFITYLVYQHANKWLFLNTYVD